VFEIKPLTWYKNVNVAGEMADTPFGRLHVQWSTADRCEWWHENKTLRELCASMEAGKVAAEAHYRTLVEKLLLPVSRPREDAIETLLSQLDETILKVQQLAAHCGRPPTADEVAKAKKFDAMSKLWQLLADPAVTSDLSFRPHASKRATVGILRLDIPAPPLSAVTADLVS